MTEEQLNVLQFIELMASHGVELRLTEDWRWEYDGEVKFERHPAIPGSFRWTFGDKVFVLQEVVEN